MIIVLMTYKLTQTTLYIKDKSNKLVIHVYENYRSIHNIIIQKYKHSLKTASNYFLMSSNIQLGSPPRLP